MSRTLEASLDVVVLVAGQSARLGEPKQHINLGDETLLANRLKLARSFLSLPGHSGKLILVSGAYLQQDCAALAQLDKHTDLLHLYNADWKTGMSSSLACAASSATAQGVLVLLIDQYRVTLEDLTTLSRLWQTQTLQPAAATYEATTGPPVIWPQQLWSKQMTGSIVLNKKTLVESSPHTVSVANANTDLDTPEDKRRALTFFNVGPAD